VRTACAGIDEFSRLRSRSLRLEAEVSAGSLLRLSWLLDQRRERERERERKECGAMPRSREMARKASRQSERKCCRSSRSRLGTDEPLAIGALPICSTSSLTRRVAAAKASTTELRQRRTLSVSFWQDGRCFRLRLFLARCSRSTKRRRAKNEREGDGRRRYRWIETDQRTVVAFTGDRADDDSPRLGDSTRDSTRREKRFTLVV